MITANKQLLWKPILSIDCSEPGFPKFSADGNNEKLLPSSIIPTNSLTQYLKQSCVISRLYTFLEKSELIYIFQFGFRQKHSTTHVLINLKEISRRLLDNGNLWL